jgi:hypothetical protein
MVLLPPDGILPPKDENNLSNVWSNCVAVMFSHSNSQIVTKRIINFLESKEK